eukprot:TRINITY_DN18244_c0_g2_i1.p1 TRINITY_DN18244_c0_g2~~TRINITY_DN18244_c0_g2_i1.p1  ORF type:complete len:330 (-),score=41.55 TRINITY_DN18244_c0_g2_i1:133-1122(-)
MQERRFYVQDCESISADRRQNSGITQGCALSPLLFITVMSILMSDAVATLSPSAKAAYQKGDLSDLAYADDTLLLGVSSHYLSEFLSAVSAAGKNYGMSLHYDKFQLLQINCAGAIKLPTGEEVKAVDSMEYLGTLLTEDGRSAKELSRRIGMAKADFNALSKVWKQSSLSSKRKVDLYVSLVESRLLYGLSASMMRKADERKLDGFQARCLRQALRIPHAWESRISNASVLEKAQHMKASILLQRKQLMYLGKVMRADHDSALRTVSFSNNHLQPATSRYIRRIGRPRLEWVPTVLDKALSITASMDTLKNTAQDVDAWKKLVCERIS